MGHVYFLVAGFAHDPRIGFARLASVRALARKWDIQTDYACAVHAWIQYCRSPRSSPSSCPLPDACRDAFVDDCESPMWLCGQKGIWKEMVSGDEACRIGCNGDPPVDDICEQVWTAAGTRLYTNGVPTGNIVIVRSRSLCLTWHPGKFENEACPGETRIGFSQ